MKSIYKKSLKLLDKYFNETPIEQIEKEILKVKNTNMAKFIICKVKIVHVNPIGKVTNDPINIDLINTIQSRDENNGYGKIYPVIYFIGVGIHKTWNYGENGHQLRDEQYNEILNQNMQTC